MFHIFLILMLCIPLTTYTMDSREPRPLPAPPTAPLVSMISDLPVTTVSRSDSPSTIYSDRSSRDGSPTGSPREFTTPPQSPRADAAAAAFALPEALHLSVVQQPDGTLQLRIPIPAHAPIYCNLTSADTVALTKIIFRNPRVTDEEATISPERLLVHHDASIIRALARAGQTTFAQQLPQWAQNLEAQSRHLTTVSVTLDTRPITLAKAALAGLGTAGAYGTFQLLRPRHADGRFLPILPALSTLDGAWKATAFIAACGFGIAQIRKIVGYMHGMAERNDEQNKENQALQTELMRALIEEYDERVKQYLATLEHDVTDAHENIEQLQTDLGTMQTALTTVQTSHDDLKIKIQEAAQATADLCTVLTKKHKKHRHRSEPILTDSSGARPGGADSAPSADVQ